VSMRRCPSCAVTFVEEERTRCLYCDTLLMATEEEDTDLRERHNLEFFNGAYNPVIQQVVEERGIETHTRLQFIVASYFRTRTFHFMHLFSRKDFLKGKVFRRPFIQPIDWTSLLILPWMIVNIFDTIYCRLSYRKYCPQCGWKFYKFERSRHEDHNHRECAYNKEYQRVIDEILSGNILYSEKEFRRLGKMKKAAGYRSAYWDLCARKEYFSGVLDITCIWFSIGLWTLVIIWLSLPAVVKFVSALQGD